MTSAELNRLRALVSDARLSGVPLLWAEELLDRDLALVTALILLEQDLRHDGARDAYGVRWADKLAALLDRHRSEFR